MSSSLFNKQFTCTAVDPEGKQFDDVSRINAVTQENDYKLVLDYNCAIYDIKQGQNFILCISPQLSSESDESGKSDEHWHPSMIENSSIAYTYEYIMHGKVYEYVEKADQYQATVYISYGGLLMSLEGDRNTISEIQKGKEVYLLIRKA